MGIRYARKEILFHSIWFSIAMVIVSLIMLDDYTRLVLATDDSTRKIIVLIIWGIIVLGWAMTSIMRLRSRKTQ